MANNDLLAATTRLPCCEILPWNSKRAYLRDKFALAFVLLSLGACSSLNPPRVVHWANLTPTGHSDDCVNLAVLLVRIFLRDFSASCLITSFRANASAPHFYRVSLALLRGGEIGPTALHPHRTIAINPKLFVVCAPSFHAEKYMLALI